MKTFKKVLFSMLAATAMWSCSDDKMGPDGPDKLPGTDGEGFYMALDIQMPNGQTGSRSMTDNNGGSTGGTEVGSDKENAVTSALIVLAQKSDDATKNFGFIAAGEVQSSNISSLTGSSTSKEYRTLARIQKTNLNQFYENLGATTVAPEVYVFVFCNPTSELREAFTGANTPVGDNQWINKTCSVIQSAAGNDKNVGVWGANSFLMNNVNLTTRALPAKLLDWEKFNAPEKPFHLSDNNTEVTVDNSQTVEGRGAVKVERSVARFDFKDGSGAGTAANTYHVLFQAKGDGTVDTDKPLVSVELQKMALVNMSNSFYYLPRVSDNGLPRESGYELCGKEKPWERDKETGVYKTGNYVVGPYATEFGGNTVTTGFSQYFNFAFFEDNGTYNNATMAGNRWNVCKVADVLRGEEDNYKDDVKYHVWRYVTENVIPSDPLKQTNGLSTGVVFKARMRGTSVAENGGSEWQNWDKDYVKNVALCLNGKAFKSNGQDHAAIKGNSKDDPILYYYDGHLYMTWNHIRQAAIQASVTIGTGNTIDINRSNSLYKAVFGDGPITKEQSYIKDDGTRENISDPMWTADPTGAQAAYDKSADCAWTAWATEGKPVPPTLGDEANAPASLKNMREKVTAAGITIFQSSVDEGTPGYYCYYYYWNRHNDNDVPGVMAPMEFAVVRNNVYKLSVDKISRLGHPRIPGNDPDKPTPGTPDESDLVYLDVKVEITAWSVRVNNIEF